MEIEQHKIKHNLDCSKCLVKDNCEFAFTGVRACMDYVCVD